MTPQRSTPYTSILKHLFMKKHMFIAASALVVLTACSDPKQDKAVVRERDSLLAVIDERERSVNDFMASFNEVERNLDSVTRRQNIILTNSNRSDLKADQKARINDEIRAINELMEVNNKKLKELSRRVDKSDKKNVQLQKTIETLTNQLNQKYVELAELNEKLNSLNVKVAQLQTSVDTLSSENMSHLQTIANQTSELHAAYYIVGSSKDLEKSNLIDKKGGLLGIGKTAKITDEVDKNKFTRIDYTQVTSIAINSKDMKMVTSHPEDSYSVDKTGKTINAIQITNPEKFWSISKYLVIIN